MSGRLDGTKAVITGGAGAIGMATARAFLREGASVFVTDVDGGAVDEAVEALAKLGPASGEAADVRSPVEVGAMMGAAAAAMGGVSALINNAGVNAWGPLETYKDADIDLLLDVNIKGVMLCTRAAIPYLVTAPNASVTSTSSQAGKRGWAGISVYCATKAAVLGFSRAMAVELAPRVRVNAVCPGHITGEGMAWRGWEQRKSHNQTIEAFGRAFIAENVPLQRGQTAADIAAGFVFLTSAEASEITGAALNIGGGVVMD